MARTWHHGWKWNYKKGPPRKRASHRLLCDRLWMQKEPKWWRREFKHKRRRAELRRKRDQLRCGYDPEDMVWPLDSKPWIYYW